MGMIRFLSVRYGNRDVTCSEATKQAARVAYCSEYHFKKDVFLSGGRSRTAVECGQGYDSANISQRDFDSCCQKITSSYQIRTRLPKHLLACAFLLQK
ncbi:hypothetical protein AV540_19585 [Brevibacillus parabrevis]|nr:hypothetical protein AV540_19585 [Brevibacillus parabrevis]